MSSDKEFCDDIRELMYRYDTCLASWIRHFGSKDGFDHWFTRQCGLEA